MGDTREEYTLPDEIVEITLADMKVAIDRAVAAEREACAKACEAEARKCTTPEGEYVSIRCAAEIRERDEAEIERLRNTVKGDAARLIERDAEIEQLREEVTHWKTKAECYGDMVHGCSPALAEAGYPVNQHDPDGNRGAIAKAVKTLAFDCKHAVDAEREFYEGLLDEYTDYRKGEGVIPPIKPGHGPCCTCQTCGRPNDIECVCEHNEIAEAIRARKGVSDGLP